MTCIVEVGMLKIAGGFPSPPDIKGGSFIVGMLKIAGGVGMLDIGLRGDIGGAGGGLLGDGGGILL